MKKNSVGIRGLSCPKCGEIRQNLKVNLQASLQVTAMFENEELDLNPTKGEADVTVQPTLEFSCYNCGTCQTVQDIPEALRVRILRWVLGDVTVQPTLAVAGYFI